MRLLDDAYVEVVHWSPNLFFIPSGTVGSAFVGELSRLFKAFAAASALEAVSMMAATVLPILLLQKPSRNSKRKEHVVCLRRRLDSWLEGHLSESERGESHTGQTSQRSTQTAA